MQWKKGGNQEYSQICIQWVVLTNFYFINDDAILVDRDMMAFKAEANSLVLVLCKNLVAYCRIVTDLPEGGPTLYSTC
jgi:hypothetical protein